MINCNKSKLILSDVEHFLLQPQRTCSHVSRFPFCKKDRLAGTGNAIMALQKNRKS